MTDAKLGKPEYLQQAKLEHEAFSIFVRTLVGLDREVAKGIFDEFLVGTTYNANQIEFINLIINQLVDHGTVDVGVLYESPSPTSRQLAPMRCLLQSKPIASCSCWKRSNKQH